MKKLIIFYSFIISSFLTLTAILNARNFIEVITAFVFSLVSYYFFMLLLPRKIKDIHPIVYKKNDAIEELPIKIESGPKYDFDRRKFLKLIGAAGGSLFLMAIFTKGAEASFFGSMPGPGAMKVKNASGLLIDPAEKKPTDGYNITEIDDTGDDTYYGYVDKDGKWYILKELSTGAYRYTKGSSGFSTNWTLRNSLSYGYFNDVF